MWRAASTVDSRQRNASTQALLASDHPFRSAQRLLPDAAAERNLVRNAVSHTNPGDRVTVTARAQDGRLEISVSDTGPGIPPDQLEQIFERFHRLDHSRSRDRGGSGLGLAIARAIVEAHGGRIHAESPPGQGAAFVVELPGYQPAR